MSCVFKQLSVCVYSSVCAFVCVCVFTIAWMSKWGMSFTNNSALCMYSTCVSCVSLCASVAAHACLEATRGSLLVPGQTPVFGTTAHQPPLPAAVRALKEGDSAVDSETVHTPACWTLSIARCLHHGRQAPGGGGSSRLD